jgi:hypothetical protein
MSSGTTADLYGVWGTGPNDVFAVGIGTILHWDGKTWSGPSYVGVANAPVYLGVWGSGPNDVYAVGLENGLIEHWDGTSWSPIFLPASVNDYFQGVWGSGPDDVFVAGNNGIFHWNGTAWSKMSIPSSASPSFRAVWGTGPGDVFAVGDDMALHWDGASWSQMDLGVVKGFATVWGSGPNDVLAAGVDPVQGPTIVRWDGTAWSAILATSLVDPHTFGTIAGFWGTAPGDVYLVSGGIQHLGGDSWFTTTVPSGSNIRSVWAAGPDDSFAITERGGVFRWTGMAATETGEGIALPNSDGVDAWGSGSNDVFAITSSHIQHWDGTTWMGAAVGSPGLDPPGFSFYGLWGYGPHDVFAVGGPVEGSPSCVDPPATPQAGLVSHWDGSSWSMPVRVTNNCLSAIWGSGPSDMFVVGAAGAIFRWDGKSWSAMSSGSTDVLSSVWGSGPSDVYAVGAAGTIVHFDGTRWSAMDSGTTDPLLRVRGSGRGDVFVMGAKVLLHLRTGVWESIALPAGFTATALWVTPSRVFLAAADQILHLDRLGVTCVGPEKNCGDGWDNDCDGLVDAADPDCAGKVVEQCANGVDDDQNGLTDCADPACAMFPSCKHR